MALNSLGLGFVFTATDLASGKMRGIAQSFGGMDAAAQRSSRTMQQNFARLGAGAVVLGGGVATLMGGLALANTASQFSQEVARAGAISRASAGDILRLRDAAIEAGIATQFSPTEAVQGLTDLAQGGMNATQSIESLRGVLAFAAGGQVQVTEAAAAVSSALRVFALDANQAGMVSDQFLRITNSTALAAGDMEQAMGSVARGAISAHQSITEMLPSIGLVKNTGVDVSVAAQSVSSALVFMAGRADKFRDIGVSVTDASGAFRPLMDIILETSQVLDRDYPNAADRAAKATELFSRFGLQAYTGISQQLATGVRDANGRLYQGADAIAYLRSEMQNASGTAQHFTDLLNDTFEGRKTLLRGSLQTLGILIGEGFEGAWKPIVEGITDGVNFVLGILNQMPKELRIWIAQFVTWGGTIAAFFGAFVVGKAIFALLAPFVGSLTVALGGLLATMAPLVASFALFTAIGYAFNRWIDASYSRSVAFAQGVAQVKYGLIGLFDLISTGRLSGDTLAMLNQPFMASTKRFIANVVAFGFRIQQFFRGVRIGFNAAIDSMGPAIARAGGAFGRLWSYLRMVFGVDSQTLIGGSSRRYMEWGATVGDVIGRVLEVVINIATGFARFVTGFIGGFRSVIAIFAPGFRLLGEQFGKLWDAIVSLGRVLGLVGDEVGNSRTGVELFGQVIGAIAGGAVSMLAGALTVVVRILRFIVEAVTWVIQKFRQLSDVAKGLGVGIVRAFFDIKFAVLDMIDSAIAKMGQLMAAIPAGLRPQFAENAIAAGQGAEQRMATRNVQRSLIDTVARTSVLGSGPATAEARQRTEQTAASTAAAREMTAAMARQMVQRAVQQTIVLQVDGETIARVNANATTNNRERSFAPGGGGEG